MRRATAAACACLAACKTRCEVADAAADLVAVGTQWESAFPQSNRGIRLVAVPIEERYGAPFSGWLPFLLAGLIVVAVASANVGNLMLTRGAQRARELAIRTALGASRGRVVRQLLIESALIGGAACALGFVISRAGVLANRNGIPENLLPYWINYSVDAVTLLALPAIALVTAAVFALVPAFAVSRTDVVSVLKDGGRADTGRRGSGWAATTFLAVELALAIMMLAQIGAPTISSFSNDVPTDRLLEDRRVFTGALTMAPGAAADLDARRGFYDSSGGPDDDPAGSDGGVTRQPPAARRCRESPPPSGRPSTGQRRRRSDRRVGRRRPWLLRRYESPAHARPVVPSGRSARGAGTGGRQRAAGESALSRGRSDRQADRRGARSRRQDAPTEWRTIVGVVPDVRQRAIPEVQPIAYLPLAAAPPASVWLLVRSSTDAASLAAPVREALRQLDPGVPLSNPRTLERATRDFTWANRVSARFASIVCIATFVLATVGLYAVVAHRAAQRRREFGLRVVLGARTPALIRLVTGNVQAAVWIGLVLGLAGAMAWDRAFSPARQTLRVADPLVLAVAVGALALAVGLGCALPIRRAVGVSPADVLRESEAAAEASR